MGMVSLKQSQEVQAKVGINCLWDEVAIDQAQEAVRDPIRLGREYTRFLQNGGRVEIVYTGGIVPPGGGQVLIVTVPVSESRDWKDAAGVAGPNTSRDSDIWKVGGQYPPVAGAKPRLQQIFLANFGKYSRSEGNLVWAKEQYLVPASPRAVFAIGEHCPYLNLAMDSMAVVSLAKCFFEGGGRACFVWWGGSERRAYLYWFDFEWCEDYWFAFVRESE